MATNAAQTELKPDEKGFRYVLLWMRSLFESKQGADSSYLMEWIKFTESTEALVKSLAQDKAALVQQVEAQAQEARTQREIVHAILRKLGLPERDFEAESLVADYVSNADKANDQLAGIHAAINEYYQALDNRQHGGVAQNQAFTKIQEVLGMHWKQGAR